MSSNCLYHCARIGHRLLAICLVLVAFSCFDHSSSFATSFDLGSIFGSSSPALEIRVVDTAGPIEVDHAFTGIASNGLPTIEVYEKLRQPPDGNGSETNFWSDVQIEVIKRTGDDHSIIDQIDDIIDHIFGFLNKNLGNSQSSGEDWEDGIDVGIDKFVKNKTGVLLTQYRIVLGMGIGDNFVPSTPGDDLYIRSSPMPKEVTDLFESPPGAGEDNLQWTSDGVNKPGLNNEQEAVFWFGVHVPRKLFMQDPQDDDVWKAQFTIRQHTAVPEPTVLVLFSLGALTVTCSGRFRR